MAKVDVFVWMAERAAGDAGFQSVGRPTTFTRVPAVGEFVNLGDDIGGHSADYKVALVVHDPIQEGHDADVYLERAEVPHELEKLSQEIKGRPNDRANFLPKGFKAD